jgi:hypothetical protein
MKELLWILLGVVGSILLWLTGRKILPGKKPLSGNGPGKTEEDYQKTKEGVVDELEKKPAADIVGGLDNAGDIGTVKQESDDEFDRILERHRDGAGKDLDG